MSHLKMNYMFKTKKYYILFLIPVLMLFFAMPFTGCNPHRRGSVIKGKGAKSGRHTRPASAKHRRR
ncbi:MAG: hypothetical protein ACPGSL_06955 [Vicingaceae bacterium]